MTHLFQNYGRIPVALVKGQGVQVTDSEGKEYIDFGSGLGVTNLGHCHPKVVQAVQEQAANLFHSSNLYINPLQEQVATKLAELSGLDRAFFCNSGAEANEAAIKLARKYSQGVYGAHKHEVLSFQDAFHGRTMATLAATPRAKFQEGFAPLPTGFRYVEKDLVAVEAAISDATCAILVEAVQGEGGLIPLPAEFLQGLRQLCDAKGLLLIMDEVQTGIGRTGTMFAYQQMGVLPDIVSLAKGLGNGVPVGAILAKEEIAAVLTPGSHGTTFGGNPLAMAAALAVLQVIEEENVLANAKAMGAELTHRLEKLAEKFDFIVETRGVGLMLGVAFDRPVAPIVNKCLEKGLIVLSAGEKVLRLLPALIIDSRDIHFAINILEDVLSEVGQEAVQV